MSIASRHHFTDIPHAYSTREVVRRGGTPGETCSPCETDFVETKALRARSVSFGRAMQKIMQKRVYLGCGHIGMGCDVPGGTEKRVRVASFEGAVEKIMKKRIIPRIRDIGILREIKADILQINAD
jgi:hypothetical protein